VPIVRNLVYQKDFEVLDRTQVINEEKTHPCPDTFIGGSRNFKLNFYFELTYFSANTPRPNSKLTIYLEKLQTSTSQAKPAGGYPLDYGRWGFKSSTVDIQKR
jgi:hypothetical protein